MASLFGTVRNALTPPAEQPAANQADFLGEGTFGTQRGGFAVPLAEQTARNAELASGNAIRASNANPTPYGTPISQGGTATQHTVEMPSSGVSSNTFAAIPGGTPAAGAPAAGGVYNGVGPIQDQIAVARNLGGSLQQQGQGVYNSQGATSDQFGNAGQGFKATSQSIAGGPSSAPPQMVSLTGGPGGGPLYAPAPAQKPAFNLGAQQKAQSFAAPANVNTANLGQVGSVMSQLGQAPGGVAGQLGAAPTVAGVGNVAGRLGGAPSVGNVANIGTGAAPGAVAPQLGNLGLSAANQQGMLGRVNNFLDAPDGPSVAEAQLKSAQADNMAQMIGAARGRGGAGTQAQMLRSAISEGGAIASDTAGQLATLRAQEVDMRKNRDLSAMGLGGQMSTDLRGQDLAFRGQDLGALQGDQSTALGARGQDLSASMANQSTQTALEQLRAQSALGARGQDLSALQGDQSTGLGLSQLGAQTALGARGQDLSALQGDQSTALGARGQNLQGLSVDTQAQLEQRGQNLSAAQGNQQTQLGARGQNVTQELGLAGTNAQLRGQDINALMSDADRNLQAQDLSLRGGLGYGQLQNQAMGQGLDFLGQANNQAVMTEGMAQDSANQFAGNLTQIELANQGVDAQMLMQQNEINARPSFLEQLGLSVAGNAGQVAGGVAMKGAMSDRTAKVDIADATDGELVELLELFEPQTFAYADPAHGEGRFFGGMAQDLQRSELGRTMVVRRPDGFLGVDDARAGMAALAAVAMLFRRMRASGSI